MKFYYKYEKEDEAVLGLSSSLFLSKFDSSLLLDIYHNSKIFIRHLYLSNRLFIYRDCIRIKTRSFTLLTEKMHVAKYSLIL